MTGSVLPHTHKNTTKVQAKQTKKEGSKEKRERMGDTVSISERVRPKSKGNPCIGIGYFDDGHD